MAHAYQSADFVLLPTPVAPPIRAINRERIVNKTKFWTQCATCWPIYALNELLFLFPTVSKPSEFTEETLFKINHDFGILKNSKLQKRGKMNLIGRLQLSTEKARKEENESIMQLRILRTQEAIIKILKMRKVSNFIKGLIGLSFS